MTKIQTNERRFVGIVFFMSVMIRTVLGWYYPVPSIVIRMKPYIYRLRKAYGIIIR